MNFKELLEGAEPKMPGAPSGIKIMTPQQFVASAGDSKSDDEEELKEFAPYDHNDSDDDFDGEEDDEELRSLYDTKAELEAELDYAEDDEEREQLESDLEDVHARIQQIKPDAILEQGVAEGSEQTPDQVRQTLNAWMEQDQQYEDPTQRAGFQTKVWPYIQQNIKTILADKGEDGKGSYPASPYAAWLLVQHMDAYPQNQGEFLQQLAQSGLNPGGKLQFLKDRYEVNKWILQNANNEEYFINNKPLPNPTVNVRNPAMFKDAGIVATSRKEALNNAINAGNKLLVGAVRATKAKTQPSYKQGVAEGLSDTIYPNAEVIKSKNGKPVGEIYQDGNSWGCFHYRADRGYDFIDSREEAIEALKDLHQETGRSRPDYTVKGVAEGLGKDIKRLATGKDVKSRAGQEIAKSQDASMKGDTKTSKKHFDRYDKLDKLANKGVAEGQEHLDRIRKLSGLDEATKLPASTRDLGGQEFQDYMNRIVGTPDKDKAGNVKIDKKGNEKYVSGKTKGDKYKMPYIHRSSVVTYLSPDGQTYDEDAVKKTLAIRPKALLKQNEKMKHSNGEFEQFFNVGFAALVGIALDEQTNNLIVVNTCPGAGSCKVDCFAMKGGKIQFKAAWQSDGRILTYLLNDPDGFFNQLSREISAEASAGAKGDKKFPKGWQTTIRWHDAGDFFSPEYLDMALKMAAKHPDVKFYAYTKMAGAALAQKPSNFIINWSEGAHTSQEKQVKAKDANLDTTKNSRIVPDELFQDLLVKDQKGNLVKGEAGQWQVQPTKLPELKQRLAKEYGISANSILSYDEYMAKRKSIPAGMKYNVIVAPGEGDISANDPNIVSTLLLRH